MLRERGVDVTDEASPKPYGIDFGIRDPFGNAIRIAPGDPARPQLRQCITLSLDSEVTSGCSVQRPLVVEAELGKGSFEQA